jgi:hypothetical protein
MAKRADTTAQPDFAAQAELAPRSFAREMWDFVRVNKKWWLTPIIIVLLVLGALIIIGGTAAAPFIYTLF